MKSKFFEKQEQGITIVSAKWVADKNKPDHPTFWDTCLFKMSDGSRYRVKKKDLVDHDWKWCNDYQTCKSVENEN